MNYSILVYQIIAICNTVNNSFLEELKMDKIIFKFLRILNVSTLCFLDVLVLPLKDTLYPFNYRYQVVQHKKPVV